MPLDLSYRQPSAEAVKKISDFARKTGDYASLSAVDIRVLAVTYDLEVEMVGPPTLDPSLSSRKPPTSIIQ